MKNINDVMKTMCDGDWKTPLYSFEGFTQKLTTTGYMFVIAYDMLIDLQY